MAGTYPEAAAIASPARRPWRPRLPGLHGLLAPGPPVSATSPTWGDVQL